MILDKASAASLKAQQATPDLLASPRVQLLQRFVAINPLSAAALAAHGFSAQDIADQSLEEAMATAQSLALPVHSLRYMHKQLHWGEPMEAIEDAPGAALLSAGCAVLRMHSPE